MMANLTEVQPFRLWLGAAEYLFRSPDLLEECLETAIEDNTFRADDLEFTFAARVRAISLFDDQTLILVPGLESAGEPRQL